MSIKAMEKQASKSLKNLEVKNEEDFQFADVR